MLMPRSSRRGFACSSLSPEIVSPNPRILKPLFPDSAGPIYPCCPTNTKIPIELHCFKLNKSINPGALILTPPLANARTLPHARTTHYALARAFHQSGYWDDARPEVWFSKLNGESRKRSHAKLARNSRKSSKFQRGYSMGTSAKLLDQRA